MKIISGMHRSGTSLVTRLFHETGADLGDSGTFYRSDKWNPDGYYEQTDIHSINIPLINGPFGKLSYFRLPSTRTILKRAGKHADAIKDCAAKYSDCVVKETRFCLTLPAWLKYGTEVPGILICLRDPVQVAESLRKRNHISLSLGYRLWVTHNERILEHAGEIPVHFVYYMNLLQADTFVPEVAAAMNFFDFDPGEAKLLELRDHCVDPKRSPHLRTDVEYPERVRELWSELQRRHREQTK